MKQTVPVCKSFKWGLIRGCATYSVNESREKKHGIMKESLEGESGMRQGRHLPEVSLTPTRYYMVHRAYGVTIGSRQRPGVLTDIAMQTRII